jgi:hypothetical protein
MERYESKKDDQREREAMTTPDSVPAPVDRHDQPSSVFQGTASDHDDEGSNS